MITITGKNGIKATVLAYSITQTSKMMITWEIEYPRLILAELNTHRQLSKNSFSSRAVPFLKMLEQLDGEPVRFGANQPGMQDKGEDYNADVFINIPWNRMILHDVLSPKAAWSKAKELAVGVAEAFFAAGYHKQVYNRLLEAWQMQKTVLSATEVDNFFWLRDDDAADPTIRELARVMREAKEASIPEVLQPGDWHLPYIDIEVFQGERRYSIFEGNGSTLRYLGSENAIKVSCARCAAVSYRNEGYDLAKSLEVYDRLVGSERKHASAFEHQATPMIDAYAKSDKECMPVFWEDGVSHMDRDGFFWSGNLQGWLQYRKLIPNECYHAPV